MAQTFKVVKNKNTGEILYRESPEIVDGIKALKSASAFAGLPEKDLVVADITQKNWDDHVKAKKDKKKDITLSNDEMMKSIAYTLLKYMRDELGLSKTDRQFETDITAKIDSSMSVGGGNP